MLNVFITVDTEIWCNGWSSLDHNFPDYFKKYIYGPTVKGNFALPETLKILNDYDLPAVFFVEPLFSARFGLEPLSEIVGLIKKSNQEIQLHLHPEWVNEVGDELLTGVTEKSPNMSAFDQKQQSRLISWGLERLGQAGVENINAFRAGSYTANRNTLRALAENGLMFDSSYNFASDHGVADIAQGQVLTQPCHLDGVYEYPVSIIQNKRKKRILQITACSYQEFVSCLNKAYELQLDSIVIVTHNFELLSPNKECVDRLVHQRFIKLCQFLADNKDRFNVRGFHDLIPININKQPDIIKGSFLSAGLRTGEQILRRVCYR